MSTRSVAVGKIAPGAVTVTMVRIRAGEGQRSAILEAVSPRVTSETSTVSVISGFGR